jgi:hypothetical protein
VGATVKPGGSTPDPLYWRLLRLTAVRPNGWQRAVLVEGITAIAVILTLADVASAWTLLVLPLAAALIVKAHDYLAQSMPQAPHASAMSDAGNTGDGAGAAGAEKPR